VRGYFPVMAVVALAMLGLGALLRHMAIEPEWIGVLCDSRAPAWWCTPRHWLILFFHHGGFGGVALGSALLALVVRRRGLVATAVVMGGIGSFLYNPSLAAPALVLALMLSFTLTRAPR